jgi:hypothetical protein
MATRPSQRQVRIVVTFLDLSGIDGEPRRVNVAALGSKDLPETASPIAEAEFSRERVDSFTMDQN